MSTLVLPSLDGVKINVKRSVIYSTKTQESTSGVELRASFWTYPRYRIALEFEFLRSASYWKSTQTEYEQLIGFFARHQGNYDSFYFQIPDDYYVGNLTTPASTTSMPIGVGNGTTTTFQLQRTLVPSSSLPAAASRSYYPTYGDGYEPIFVNNSAPSIFVNTTLKTLTTDYTISNGMITFVSAPALNSIISWTGSYYWKCRMEKDEYDFERMLNGIWESKSIKMITVKG